MIPRGFIRPTTKAKQREFLDRLIILVRDGEISNYHLSRLLFILRCELHNRKMRGRGRTISPPAWMVEPEVWKLYLADPKRGQEDISRRVGVSIGRVNEILNGKRH